MNAYDPEDMFPPRPGGMVETARARMRAEAEQLAGLEAAAPAPAAPRIGVPVREFACEFGRARTFSVATGGGNPIVELLGADPQRRYAVVMTLDEPVVISFSQTAAEDPRNAVNGAGLSANGFVLPVNVPVPVPAGTVIYCTATSATPSRVSVMAFGYKPADD